MPLVTVDLWEGRSIEVKKKLAQDITHIICENIKCPESAVTIIFRDAPKHNWAIGGKLSSEIFKD